MQLTVTVSDEIAHEALTRGLPVVDFVESLIDKGIRAAQGRPELAAAMQRMQALRAAALGGNQLRQS
ncbi:MAG TPA: hypothetical protein VH308_14115 [Terracidiphilus sp.]|jgi:hypothetical protein|nr:hypothetical protein [Terracidiphilus sp.]